MYYRSIARGQQRIRTQNKEAQESFNQRFEIAIEKEQSKPTVTSIKEFCKIYGFSKRTIYQKYHKEKLEKIKKIPSLKTGKESNPHTSPPLLNQNL